VGPRAGLDRCGKSHPHWDSIPGSSSPYPVVIQTERSDPHILILSNCNLFPFMFSVKQGEKLPSMTCLVMTKYSIGILTLKVLIFDKCEEITALLQCYVTISVIALINSIVCFVYCDIWDYQCNVNEQKTLSGTSHSV
jgi:hypothetical protein